jgi:hypothetical protein
MGGRGAPPGHFIVERADKASRKRGRTREGRRETASRRDGEGRARQRRSERASERARTSGTGRPPKVPY